MRKMEGNAIWIDSQIFARNISDRESIYSSFIKDACLDEQSITFSCSSNDSRYEIKMKRIKDTNFQGEMSRWYAGLCETHKVNFQVFDNRLGIILEGDWNEGDSINYWCVIKLYFV